MVKICICCVKVSISGMFHCCTVIVQTVGQSQRIEKRKKKQITEIALLSAELCAWGALVLHDTIHMSVVRMIICDAFMCVFSTYFTL